MDKNNQYGNAVTKPLPYSYIKKEKEVLCLPKLDLILENLAEKNKIGQLFIVDIKFGRRARR